MTKIFCYFATPDISQKIIVYNIKRNTFLCFSSWSLCKNNIFVILLDQILTKNCIKIKRNTFLCFSSASTCKNTILHTSHLIVSPKADNSSSLTTSSKCGRRCVNDDLISSTCFSGDLLFRQLASWFFRLISSRKSFWQWLHLCLELFVSISDENDW